MKHSDKEIAIISYLQWNLKKDALVDLPCYSSSAIQERIRDICNTWGSTKEDLEIVKILAPLTDNPNAEDENGRTMIYIAAFWKQTEIVKILASLTDNPNAPNKDGKTPSSVTKNAEIQRYLKSISNTSKNLKHQQTHSY